MFCSNCGEQLLESGGFCGKCKAKPENIVETTTNNQPVNVTVIQSSDKSVAVALLLSVFLGPLGMLYSTIVGAIIMFVITIVVGFLTFGFGLLLTHPICVIWSVIAVNMKNKKQIAKAEERLQK